MNLKKLNDAYLMLLFLNRNSTKKIMQNIDEKGSTVTQIMIRCRTMEHSQISFALSELKKYRIVNSVKVGITSVFRINEDRIREINGIIQKAKNRGLFEGLKI